MKLLIQLVREILHLSGKSQGKVREFQTPMAVATMINISFFKLYMYKISSRYSELVKAQTVLNMWTYLSTSQFHEQHWIKRILNEHWFLMPTLTFCYRQAINTIDENHWNQLKHRQSCFVGTKSLLSPYVALVHLLLELARWILGAVLLESRLHTDLQAEFLDYTLLSWFALSCFRDALTIPCSPVSHCIHLLFR